MATALDMIIDQTTEQKAEADARLAQLTNRVSAIRSAKVDAVASTTALKAVPVSPDNAPAQVVIEVPGHRIAVGDVAHQQLANHFDIRREYYDRLRAPENAPLLAANLNWWFEKTPDVRLLRMLSPKGLDDVKQRQMAQVNAPLFLRGFLGKGYRTIDDADLVIAAAPAIEARGLQLRDYSLDERRLHAKFVSQAQTIDEIVQKYATKYGITKEQAQHHFRVDGVDISWVNETLGFGVAIRHSEVGFASLSVSFFEEVLKCLNHYVGINSIAVRHVGGKNGQADDDVRFITEATQALDNAALMSRVTDTIDGMFDEKAVAQRAAQLCTAKVEGVARPEVPLFEFVGNIGTNLGLNLDQVELLKEETQKAIIEEKGESKFAYAQGLTAVARQVTDYDRRLELEREGFRILTNDAEELVKLGREMVTQRRN